MPFYACKLPHGLRVEANGKFVTLRGANTGTRLDLVDPNGIPVDNANRYHGYGITEISDDGVKTFTAWADSVTYNGGVKENGKVENPFPALENGSILGPFKTREDAQKEIRDVEGIVVTGFEGIDTEKEAKKKGGVQKREDD